jgi:hypothetical protein
MIITRVGPVSFAKVSGFLYALIGLLVGGILSLVAMAGGFASDAADAAGLGAIISVGAVIILPIVYGLMGFVATLIAAWLYNLAAGLVGGVEVDVQ